MLSWVTGVLGALLHSTWVWPGQASKPLWIGLTALWVAATAWGYLYWWPRGTLTYERKLYPVSQILFGLLWGVLGSTHSGALVIGGALRLCPMGQRFAGVLSALRLRTNLSVWLVGHPRVAPHNRRATNAKKVLFAHMPFLLIALVHFTLFGDVRMFVGFHAIALACSAVAMRFPPFWETDGPPVNRDSAIGI